MNLSKYRRIAFILATGGLLTLAVIVLATQPGHAAGPWYVAPGGDDGNDCQSPGTACGSINGALAKPGFVISDTILVATGTYTGTGDEVVLLDKDAILSGGWDIGFTGQSGISIIDGEAARRGMTVNGGVSAVVQHFTVRNGSSEGHGGGISCGGNLSLNNCTVTGNMADQEGGGIFNGGSLSLNNCAVSANHTNWNGGGIYNEQGTVSLRNSSISGNEANMEGGGVHNGVGTMNLENTTVAGNRSGLGGGGLSKDYGTLTLSNCTVTGNSTGRWGGGISHLYAGVTVQNTIVAGNMAWSGGPDCSGSYGVIESSGYNLIGDMTDCDFSLSVGDLTDVSPNLGPLIGTPAYHPLSATSPAVDAGNPAGCTDEAGNPLDTDQRGAARVGRCDIGSYEYTTPGPGASISPLGGTPQRKPPFLTFDVPFLALVLDSIGSPVSNTLVTFAGPASGASGTFADSGSYATTVQADEFGMATATTFTANAERGSYTVTATVGGVVAPANYQLTNIGWYVSHAGDDANDCQIPTMPCATITGPFEKAAFFAGDTVLVTSETYTGTGDEVVLLDRDVTLSGGWNAGFTTQSGTSTIDGEGARRGMTVNQGVAAIVERLDVLNGSAQSGGGIKNDDGTLTLRDSTVSRCAGTFGGGIHNGNGTMTLYNTTTEGNTSDYKGGGIHNGGTMILNNSTVSGNTAVSDSAGLGGGISSSGDLTLNNSTVSGNTADSGGGIWRGGGTVTLQNSILADNMSGNGPDCSGRVGTLGYNLIGDTSLCDFTPGTGDLTNVSANLGPLVGSPGHHPLLSGSPAIDAIPLDRCFVTTDQRGVSRPQGPACDMGAFEYTIPGPAASIVAFGGTPQFASLHGVFETPLQALVLDAIGSPVSDTAVSFYAPESGPSGIFADSGTYTTTTSTAGSGLATAAAFTANGLVGGYTVKAMVHGVVTPTSFLLGNFGPIFLPCLARNYCPDFFDDFSNPASGWEVVDNSFVRTQYVNGEYRILTRKAGYFYLFKAPSCDRQDYVVEVDARWVGTPGSSYGLIFGINSDGSRYYLFDMNTDYQMYRLLRRDPGGFTTIVPVTSSSAIHGGTASNHLRVVRNGNQITLAVNGTVLGTWSDGAIGGWTGAGLVTSPYYDTPTSDARFDNFSMVSLPGGSASARAPGGVTAEESELAIPNVWRVPVPVDLGW